MNSLRKLVHTNIIYNNIFIFRKIQIQIIAKLFPWPISLLFFLYLQPFFLPMNCISIHNYNIFVKIPKIPKLTSTS